MYVFSNLTANQEKLDLIKHYYINQDRSGNFAATNSPQNLTGSEYTLSAGELCSLVSADGPCMWFGLNREGKGRISHQQLSDLAQMWCTSFLTTINKPPDQEVVMTLPIFKEMIKHNFPMKEIGY